MASGPDIDSGPVRGIALVVVAVVVGFLLIGTGLDSDAAPGPAKPKGAEVEDTTVDSGDSSASSTSSTTDTTLAARPPAEVSVLVTNGTDVNNIATQLSEELAAAGYQMGSATRAEPVEATTVFYTEGFDADAKAVAERIGFPDNPIEPLGDPPHVDPQGASVVIVLGPDYQIG